MDDQQRVTASGGMSMPRIIYGTAWKADRTEELVVTAVQAGFRGIDTACQPKHYNEPQVGAALDRLKAQGIARESLFLQTKFTPLAGQDPARIPYDPDAPVAVQVAQSFAASTKNLRTAYVDGLILHSPMAPHARLMRAWTAMEEIQAAGGARHLGISNCYHADVLRALYSEARVKPAVVQNRFYAQTGYDAELRRWCADHGLIYQAFWTLTANPHLLASDTVGTLAQSYGLTPAQLFFRYLSQSGIVPLTGTTSERHMRQDLDIFGVELSSEALAQVRLLLKQS